MEFLQSKKNIKVRRMMLSDIDAVMEIEPLAFGSHCWSRESFVQELSNDIATYLVAIDEKENKLMGYGGSWIILDEMHITTLGVHPKQRRKNAAEAIILAYIDQAIRNEVKGITLEVRLSNIAAQKLYEKYGFQRQGIRKRYYQDNYEDALLLWTENIQTEIFKELLKANLMKLQNLA